MMEFFLSKVWTFMVSAVLLGLLVQGVQMSAETERSAALQEVAEELQRLFHDLETVGPGLERVVFMGNVLPSSATLTVHPNYAVLSYDDERTFEIPEMRLLTSSPFGPPEEMDSVTLHPDQSVMFLTGKEGMTLLVLSPQTSPPGI